jgi:hypothetical protein
MDEMDSALKELTANDLAERLARIRERLPGQTLPKRIEMARVRYGRLYTLAEIRAKVAGTLPRLLLAVRGTRLEPIETYHEHIPDEALLKYDDAFQSGLFSKFWVVTPTYYGDVQVDPWIVAEVSGTDRCAVIAQWGV